MLYSWNFKLRDEGSLLNEFQILLASFNGEEDTFDFPPLGTEDEIAFTSSDSFLILYPSVGLRCIEKQHHVSYVCIYIYIYA